MIKLISCKILKNRILQNTKLHKIFWSINWYTRTLFVILNDRYKKLDKTLDIYEHSFASR